MYSLQEYILRLSDNLQRLSRLFRIEKAAINAFQNHSQYCKEPAVFLQEHLKTFLQWTQISLTWGEGKDH